MGNRFDRARARRLEAATTQAQPRFQSWLAGQRPRDDAVGGAAQLLCRYPCCLTDTRYCPLVAHLRDQHAAPAAAEHLVRRAYTEWLATALTLAQRARVASWLQHHYCQRPAHAPLSVAEAAYRASCQARPWHPIITVRTGPRYATVALDHGSACDDQGQAVVDLTSDVDSDVLIAAAELWHDTQDQWAPRARLTSPCWARGVLIALVPALVAAIWPRVSVPSAYITRGPPQTDPVARPE
jgi:hypothetical protein